MDNSRKVHQEQIVQVSAYKDFPTGEAVKNLPEMQEAQEMQVQSLGWEDPLEEGMATHSSILAWRIPWAEEPGGLQSMGPQRFRYDRAQHSTLFKGYL